MDSQLAFEARHQFSTRLRQSLLKSGYAVTPSRVAREFNLRADGAIVTPHAVRKWLLGESLPTQERILILADWLNVRASWLRFGDVANTEAFQLPSIAGLPTPDLQLLQDFQRLPGPARQLVRVVVDGLLAMAQENQSRSPMRSDEPR